MSDPIEITAIIMTLLCVVLTARQHIACWPTGLVAVVLYAYVFYQARLYSEFGLQGYYVVVQVYGWYHWLHGGRRRNDLPVTRQSHRENGLWIAAIVASSLGLGYLMASRTDAALPYADAFTTVAALVAQWLLARKKLEAWILWVVVDLVSVRNFWLRELPATTLLYAVLLVLAAMGFVAWRKSMMEPSTPIEEASAVP